MSLMIGMQLLVYLLVCGGVATWVTKRPKVQLLVCLLLLLMWNELLAFLWQLFADTNMDLRFLILSTEFFFIPSFALVSELWGVIDGLKTKRWELLGFSVAFIGGYLLLGPDANLEGTWSLRYLLVKGGLLLGVGLRYWWCEQERAKIAADNC